MPHVFINFRGRDQAGYAALLDRELTAEFGRDAVFLSSRSIAPGEDFVAKLLDLLSSCTVLLAVIGPDWMKFGSVRAENGVVETVDDRGNGREEANASDYGDDWVRREIALALAQQTRVIPILVENAQMPKESQLPADIAALSRCQYLRLHHRNIKYDLARIIEVVSGLLPAAVTRHGDEEATQSSPVTFALAQPAGTQCRVGVLGGSIRQVRSVDVWVNSENTDMEMSRYNEFTISAIIRYWAAQRDEAGAVVDDVVARELAERVGPRRPVAPGTVFVTGPGALAESNGVRHIIHVASVSGEPGAGFRQIRDLGSAVFRVLVEAERLTLVDPSVRSIILPLLGVGTGGGALRPTVTSIVGAILGYLMDRPNTALREIYLLGYRVSEFAAVTECLSADGRLTPAAPRPSTPRSPTVYRGDANPLPSARIRWG
jgi:hypothetical protein